MTKMYDKICEILESRNHSIVSGKNLEKVSNVIENEEETLKRIFSGEKYYVNNLIDFIYNNDCELQKIIITVRENGLYGYKHYYYVIRF